VRGNRGRGGIRDRKQWPHLTTVGMCYRERTIDGETTTEAHYFIGSRRMGARRYAQALRSHWGIENNLHWQLDVSFREDSSRVENRHGAANLALMRKAGARPAQATSAKKTASRANAKRRLWTRCFSAKSWPAPLRWTKFDAFALGPEATQPGADSSIAVT